MIRSGGSAQDSTDHTAAPGSVPPSPRARAARKIRFIEPTEADVHVYESQPSSLKRTVALLPPHHDIPIHPPATGPIRAARPLYVPPTIRAALHADLLPHPLYVPPPPPLPPFVTRRAISW